MEVTRPGEIVWELHNAIPGYRDNYRTAVYRAAFCPKERVEAVSEPPPPASAR